ncbi:hypothetical protein DUNSADRAFT_10297 [Dunaliella salina]|uniref:Uncharacterized protein n=1 Tax=Dunaliella salina TaxID=3046 RepID=A0ABQ7GFM0_DUNSA|nr:hypothetical protein DUNSADRAFT_10297 [Dunaliella salina]|eukprot:KAF5833391.1 hypothetical protein DUNSADRAFT_10297 [Dunaliella salina]
MSSNTQWSLSFKTPHVYTVDRNMRMWSKQGLNAFHMIGFYRFNERPLNTIYVSAHILPAQKVHNNLRVAKLSCKLNRGR